MLEPADPPPLFTFANDRHDRASSVRSDEVELAGRWADALVLLVAGDQVAADAEGPAWTPSGALDPALVEAGERVYLGRGPGGDRFALLLPGPPEGARGLRELAPVLRADEAGLLAHAVGLAQWHRGHPRCSRCGEPTAAAEAGHVRRCPACGASHFPRSDPAVIMLVTDGDDRALLGHQAVWPEGRFSTLAGFVEPGESLEDAVRREVLEETGVRVGAVRYAGSQPWPFPSSLMLGFYAEAAVDERGLEESSTAITVDGEEIAEARWFTRHDLAAACVDGAVVLPGRLSISRWLIEGWYGGELPAEWT